ncbi:discoidin domain-containing protein [Kribbella sp. CA-293567]|uniref:discoidin domain-containing protein n=1 Tax=Kribbella sp. CA-293567 TaxID=3002436 RepID=UPI0022DDF91D|nr:discoidin domain-containing protein [Kribbella sp. CA-293567]WBQ02139.1 discoidin domain-containing protein [Kribbella sp. CA-293567]
MFRSRAGARSPALLWRPVLLLSAALLIATSLVTPHDSAQASGRAQTAVTLLSQGKTATSSTAENGGTPASGAVDGNPATRWASAFADPQWLQVDLGATSAISQVVLNWEAAYAKSFQLQVSANAGGPWTTIHTTTTGTGGNQTINVTGSGRYVRLLGTERGTGFGYSLWEFQVYGGTDDGPAACSTTNAAQGKTATASSTENGGTPASAAVDGNPGTRWSSAAADPQWIQVDLGTSQTICKVGLNWEAAYGKAFQLQTSANAGGPWSTIYTTTTGTGGNQSLEVTGTGRYLRVNGTQRGTGYGYSLWELAVHTTDGGTGPVIPPTDPMNPDLGPNVDVFTPATPQAQMQARLDQVAAVQHTNQFGTERNALLFKPGTYTADVNLGFNTQVAGLGLSPDDVNINGHVRVEADWLQQGDNPDNKQNATQNFWRSAENLAVTPPNGQIERWAVAQAAPYRRMHLKGAPEIQLWSGGDGWASGGLFADTKIDGRVVSGSQQQWLSRNSEFGSWAGSVWNMVFVGTKGAPANNFPNPSHTVVGSTPQIREKPFLYVDGAGSYNVFVPALRQNTSGTSWSNGPAAGSSISLSQFLVAKPSTPVATINAALDQGKHLLFTPGIYHLNDTIKVTRPNTVVLGIGMATLTPDTGKSVIQVADVDGVKLAGLLIDAGPVNSPVLVEVGPAGSAANHAANPTSLHDVFVRVGGGVHLGRATVSLQVNSNNVIGDHLWLWRADHGDQVAWNLNTADTGLVVNGTDVTMYGLFVEHYQKYQTIWNGNGGRTYFYQNEMPYDVPDQASWSSGGGTRGWAAYKVANSVTSHEAWGVGAYSFFQTNPSIVADRGFEVPDTPGVRFHSLVSVSLGGVGTIANVINNTGGAANTATQQRYVVNYP